MRRVPAGPALLLAAWLLPLAAQVGTLAHLLQAGRHAHPSSLVELLVHGHPHGGRVPAHEHTVREGPAVRDAVSPPADLPAAAGTAGWSAAAWARPWHDLFGAAAGARAAAPVRHLLLVVLLR